MSDLLKLLTELVAVPAPSGYEEPMMTWCCDYFKRYTKQVEVDTRGNFYATFPGTGKNPLRVMLAAHMDALGFIVTGINKRGFVRFARSMMPLSMPCRRVLIHGAKGPVRGIIGTCVGYGTIPREQYSQVPPVNEMYIDLGCASDEEVKQLGIEVGQPITVESKLDTLGNPNWIVAPALDDRAGIAALAMLAVELDKLEERPEVIIVGTLEEENGLRGAGTAAFRCNPDLGFSVDTQPCADTPEYSLEKMPVQMNKGPVIKFTEGGTKTNHPRLRQLLIDAAEKNGTRYQLAAAPVAGSDMGEIEQARAGIPAAAIGMPRRYAHTPNEVMDIRDIEDTVVILKEAMKILGKGYSLKRI